MEILSPALAAMFLKMTEYAYILEACDTGAPGIWLHMRAIKLPLKF